MTTFNPTNSPLTTVLVQYAVAKLLTKTDTPFVEAELDYSPFFKQFYDNGIAVDATTINFTKVNQDTAVVTEQTILDVAKSLVDQLSAIDSQIIGVTKVVSDSVGQTDGITTIGVALSKNEFIYELEQITFDVAKQLLDNQSVTDALNVTSSKVLDADTFSVLDTKIVAFSKSLEDQIQAIDTFVGYTFADEEVDAIIVLPVGVEDDPEVTTSKVLADTTETPTDAIQTTDVIKSLTDTPVATETFSRTFNAYKYFNESQVPSDTGVILIPDYVDLTYFSEEYVGDIIRSF